MPTLEEIAGTAPTAKKKGMSLEEISAAHGEAPADEVPKRERQTSEFSQTARKRFADLNTQVAQDDFIRSLEKSDTEFAKQTYPGIAATVATAGVGGPLSLVGRPGWGLFWRLVGNAAARTATAGAAGGLTTGALGGSMKEIGESAGEQALSQGIGEGIGLTATGALHGARLLAKGASQMTSGAAYLAEKAADKITRANAMADELAAEFGRAAPSEGALTTQASSFRDSFLARHKVDVKEAYDRVKDTLVGRRADITDVADELLSVEKTWAKYRGKAGLKGLTEPSPEWKELVEGFQKGQKPREYKITTKGTPPSQMVTSEGVPIIPGTPDKVITKLGRPPNMRENAAALVTARSAANDKLMELKASGQSVRELEDGLEKLVKSIDRKISLVDPAAGEAMDIAKETFAHGDQIIHQGLYKAMQKSGDAVATHIMDGRFPSNARDFVAMTKKVGGQEGAEMLQSMRRKVFDELITSRKGNNVATDVSLVEAKMAEMGDNALVLFGPKGPEMLGNLKDLGQAARKAMSEVNVKGATGARIGEHIAESVLFHKGLQMAIPAAAGGYAAHHAGGGYLATTAATAAGALVGAKYLPPLILKVAENEKASKMLAKGISLFDKNPTQAAFLFNGAARMVMGKDELEALRKAATGEVEARIEAEANAPPTRWMPQMGR